MWGNRKQAKAIELTRKAADLLHDDPEAAVPLYRKAVELDPNLDAAWFDLGLIYKWSCKWEAAFDCNERAARLVGAARDEPAWWNLGIAATALHRWDVARHAWRTYGISIDDGEGPIEGNFGMTPVRLNPKGDGEVVWGRRIDPARVRIDNIPFPSSGHHWGDIVLHDGAPNGSRNSNGVEYPVFDELELWESSGIRTVEVSVAAEQSQLESLLALLGDAGHEFENWTSNVRVLCTRCSEGAVHWEHSDECLAKGNEHLIGVAAPRDDVASLVTSWEQTSGGQVHSIDVAD